MLSLCNVLCSWMTINHDVSPPLRLAPFTSLCPLMWHKCISPLGWIVTFRIILRPSRELLILLKGKSGETRCWHDVTLHPKLEARYNTVVKVILTDWMSRSVRGVQWCFTVSVTLYHCYNKHWQPLFYFSFGFPLYSESSSGFVWLPVKPHMSTLKSSYSPTSAVGKKQNGDCSLRSVAQLRGSENSGKFPMWFKTSGGSWRPTSVFLCLICSLWFLQWSFVCLFASRTKKSP